MTLLPQITDKTTNELAGLTASELRELQQLVKDYSSHIEVCNDLLNRALACKYLAKVTAIREEENKATGSVRFNDSGLTVFADIPLEPTWDQRILKAIANRIQLIGGNPADFMTITYSVPESKYQAWTPALREQFEPARTVEFGQQRFAFENKEAQL